MILAFSSHFLFASFPKAIWSTPLMGTQLKSILYRCADAKTVHLELSVSKCTAVPPSIKTVVTLLTFVELLLWRRESSTCHHAHFTRQISCHLQLRICTWLEFTHGTVKHWRALHPKAPHLPSLRSAPEQEDEFNVVKRNNYNYEAVCILGFIETTYKLKYI